MPKKEEIREMFNKISPSYDKLNHVLSFHVDKSWRRTAVKAIFKNHSNLNIMDLACGTGDFSIDLAKQIRKNQADTSKIVGVDISCGMLDIMRAKVAKYGYSDIISIKQGDGENLDFDNDSLDVVTIGFGIRNFEDKEKGLKEIYRTLKVGGRLVILELSLPENIILRAGYKLYFNNVLPLIGRLVSKNNTAYEYLPSSVASFPKKDVFMAMMKDAGFSKVEHKALSLGICRMYIGTK